MRNRKQYSERDLRLRAKVASRYKNQSGAYSSWLAMRARCNNPRAHGYENYGGRGISYPKEWDSFENFLADMGPRPDGYSIDRIDCNANYSKENCRWIPWKDQGKRGTRRVKQIEYRGEKKSIAEWVRILSPDPELAARRISNGWDLERACTVPKLAHRYDPRKNIQ